jgi:hypothetical protein
MIRAPLNVLKSRRQNRSHRNDRVKDPSKEGDQHLTMRQYCNHRCCDDCVTDLGPAPSRPPAPDDKKRSSRGRCLHPQKTLRRLPGAAQPTRSAKDSGHYHKDRVAARRSYRHQARTTAPARIERDQRSQGGPMMARAGVPRSLINRDCSAAAANDVCGLRRQMFRRSSAAVATSREGPRSQRLSQEGQHRRWGRVPVGLGFHHRDCSRCEC